MHRNSNQRLRREDARPLLALRGAGDAEAAAAGADARERDLPRPSFSPIRVMVVNTLITGVV